MGKVICEVCGTTYPETAAQCPICGYVNPKNAQAVQGNNSSEGENGNYQYVKGGRFSKANVKKRNQGKIPVVRNTTTSKVVSKQKDLHDFKDENHVNNPRQDEPQKHGESSKRPKGMMIVSVVLILAIIAVVIYLSVQFFGPDSKVIGETTAPTEVSASTQETVEENLTCESITLNVANIEFEKIGASRMLYVKTSPENVEEPITYMSSSESVATVSQAGMVTAVGPGETIITVSCGSASAQCVVTCTAPEETTAETTVPEESTEASETGGFKLNRKDITFAEKGSTWVLYDGNVGKSDVKFSSDNPEVAVFENGTVKAVGGGTTTVHAEYQGQKVSCIIRCNFEEKSGEGIEGNGGGVSEDSGEASKPTQAPSVNYSIHTPFGVTSDFSMKIGESMQLTLKDSDGNTIPASWTCSDDAVKISNGLVTAVKATGSTTVTATTSEGRSVSCIVRAH